MRVWERFQSERGRVEGRVRGGSREKKGEWRFGEEENDMWVRGIIERERRAAGRVFRAGTLGCCLGPAQLG
jgi:hypothetical protein